MPGLDRRSAGCVWIRHSQVALRTQCLMHIAAAALSFIVSLTFMLPPDALPPTACCATLEPMQEAG